MSKRIERDGKFYRMRRGKLVEIPPEWVGMIFHRTMRQRYFKSYPRPYSYSKSTIREKNRQAKELQQILTEYQKQIVCLICKCRKSEYSEGLCDSCWFEINSFYR